MTMGTKATARVKIIKTNAKGKERINKQNKKIKCNSSYQSSR
jgi:hypothetical protein